MRRFFSLPLLLSTIITVGMGNPNWTYIPSVAQGTQFDAQVGPNNRIHLISSRYYQLNLSGNAVVDENTGDEQQNLFRFSPAIAVGDDGSVHIVTRHDGSNDGGYDIRYRRRNSAGNWDRNYIFGNRVKRNYVVGVSWTNTDVIMSSSNATTNQDIHLWKAGSTSASALGIMSSVWRDDADSRLRGQNGNVYFISGRPEPFSWGYAYYSQASVGTGVKDRLVANKKSHNSGSGRRGFPDLALDGQNNAHFVYGTESEVYYNKYNASGQKIFGSDKRIFSNLGSWHLGTGLSAVAVSESGENIVAIALRTKNAQATDSDILWTYSTDGGVSWSSMQDTGKNSDGAEGRRRPRLVAVGDSFVLLYGETGVSGISMGVLTFR